MTLRRFPSEGFSYLSERGFAMFTTLTSTSNEKVRAMKALSEGKVRKSTGLMRVEGRKMCYEAARELNVDTLFVDEEKLTEYRDLVDLCEAQGANVFPVTAHIIEAASEAKTPQDVVLSAKIPALQLKEGPLVALDGVQDPGNCGTILRTCDAAGFGGVLMGAGCADPYSPKGVRATMGSLFRTPIVQTNDLAALLNEKKQEGYAVLVSELHGQDFYARERLPEKMILVIGSEGRGVSDAVMETATHRFKLPMAGGAESLNASVAAGILIYDIFRERHYTR